MSKYLKSPDNMLTSTWLGSIAQSYILNELRSSISKRILSEKKFLEDNGKALIQKMLDNPNFCLRIYGSADELIQNLEIYQSFPNSYRFFRAKMDPYIPRVSLYRSLKNEEYICKSDLFVILQNMALDIFPAADSCEVFPMIIAMLFSEQDQLPHRLEFIKFDQKVFDEIEMEMRESRKLCFISWSELTVLSAQFAAGNFDSMVAKFEKVNRVKRDPDEIREELKDYYRKEKMSNLFPARGLAFFLITSAAMICLNKIINLKWPEMFQPSSINKTLMNVRLFEDGDQKFVMESELAIAMWPEKLSEIIENTRKDGFHNYSTITLDEAIRQGAGRVEFIRYPIKRAKHRAVPIEGPDPEDPNDWCILAVDGFFEYMKSAITGVKIFQKYGISIDVDLEYIFNDLEKVFQPEVVRIVQKHNGRITQSTLSTTTTGKENHKRNYERSLLRLKCSLLRLSRHLIASFYHPSTRFFAKSPYFVQIETVNKMLATLQNTMKSFPLSKNVRNAENGTVHDVRETKKDRSNVQNLKNELKYLGLDASFPEIQDYAEDVQVDKAKKKRYLKTNLFDAVESCQMICVLNRIPNLKKFLHNQKGCGRVPGMKCEHCQRKKSDVTGSSVTNPPEEEIQKALENLKIESSTSSQKTSDFQNPTNESPNDNEDDKENQNPIKDQKTSKKMVSDIMNLLAQRSKVPTESSEILNDNSEKCVSESQKMELKEKISAKTEENQRLHETILKLTAENEANQRVIQQLLDKLAAGSQKKEMEEVSDDTEASRIPPVVICYVCHKEIESNDDDWLDCSRSGEKFHQVCVYFHIRSTEQCPACDDKIPNYF